MGYDFNRPYVGQDTFGLYRAIDEATATHYGNFVRAVMLSNAEYATRYQKLRKANKMKPPPSHLRIFSGYIVIRNLDQGGQYETWMPEHVFEELYAAA